MATATIQRRGGDDGWLAVFFEFWAHVLRHSELRARFAENDARFLEPLTDAVRDLAAERGRALPSDLTLSRLGVHDPQVTVERRSELTRTAGGKLKLVIADPTLSDLSESQRAIAR